MSEKKDQTGGKVIDITEHLKGSLGPQPDTNPVENTYSSVVQSSIRQDLLLSIDSLIFEAKIVQAKAFLQAGKLSDAKILFEHASLESTEVSTVYLRIINLLKCTEANNGQFLDEFKKLSADLVKDLEITYLKNFKSIEFENFVKYYQLITQFAFNFNLIDRDGNEDLLFEIMQKHRELNNSQDYDEVKKISEEIINNLNKLGKIT